MGDLVFVEKLAMGGLVVPKKNFPSLLRENMRE